MRRLVSSGICVMVLLVNSYVMAGTPGSKGVAFLSLGQGARANGMGDSFVAVADDINAIHWNPAGIAQIKEKQFTFMHSVWLDEIQSNYVACAAQMIGGIMGGAITSLDSGSIDKYDVVNGSPVAQETYSGKNIVASVSYAKKITKNCSLGATVKYIQMEIDGKKSNGTAFDVGYLYKPKRENFAFGAAVQNLGSGLKAFISEKNELPLNFKVGGAYKLLDDFLTISFDANLPADSDINFNLGGECQIKEILAIRAGYKTLAKDTIKSSNLTYGAGFVIPGTSIGLDYAYCDYDDLGDTHRVSLVTKF